MKIRGNSLGKKQTTTVGDYILSIFDFPVPFEYGGAVMGPGVYSVLIMVCGEAVHRDAVDGCGTVCVSLYGQAGDDSHEDSVEV